MRLQRAPSPGIFAGTKGQVDMPGSRLTIFGNSWFSGNHDPAPSDGFVNSYWFNTTTRIAWYKDILAGWVQFSATLPAGIGGYKVFAAPLINNNDQIVLTTDPLQLWLLNGNGGPVTLNVLPFSVAPADGTSIRLVGLTDANSVTVPDNGGAVGGCILNGDKELTAESAIEVQYVAAIGRYVMISEALKTF